jgi:sec-independent protein translocase protein TatC
MTDDIRPEIIPPDSKPIIEHLAELRNRLLWSVLAIIAGTALCYVFVEDIYGFLVQPLADAMGPDDSQRLIYTNLTEAFFTYIKVAIFAGCFLTFPIVATQIWRFIAPGLYKKERNTVLPFLIASPFLFFLGGALVYYVVLPMAWTFFLSFQSTGKDTVLPIMLEARVGDYLDLIMTLIFAFGLCFQLPILLGLLAKAGVITAEWLAAKRRYALIIIFIMAAVLTPPDIISQISLSIPLIGLYEISIFLIRRLNLNKSDANPSRPVQG